MGEQPLIQVPGQPVRVQTPQGPRAIPRIGRNGLPQCPYDIREVVEMFARKNGRHATVHFVPGGGWMARLSLRSNDPRMRLYQEGRAAEPPTEDVWFHVPKPGGKPGEYEPLDILQLGPSGVKRFLERGDTWSGTGQSRSIVEATKKQQDANAEYRTKLRQKAKQLNREATSEKRRSLLKIPFHRVGIDLKDGEAQ